MAGEYSGTGHGGTQARFESQSGDGTNGNRIVPYGEGIGKTLPQVGSGGSGDDGDLRDIDNDAELLSHNFRANTSGNASNRWSMTNLTRAIAGLLQILLNGRAITVTSRTQVHVSTSYTRPADTTAYTANDALSNSTSAPTALTFASVVLANSGGGRILRAYCTTSQTTMTGALRLHLYNGSSAPTATNDNAASPFSDTNWIGYIDFNGFTTDGSGGSAAYCEGVLSSVGPLDFIAGATTSIFGLVVVKTAFTPASTQTFTFKLFVEPV